ncbi:hypothetical protein H2203_008658 [Taxawa tesnikishii (nom. ined.)]|nr:hypothetical protein H2203_008658 [Dothideales sp. JES 119]
MEDDPIVLSDSEDEDENLERAIAMSLQDQHTVAAQSPSTSSVTSTQVTTAPATSRMGIMGLDRKAMEQERLARLAARNNKRERSISPPTLGRPSKIAKSTNRDRSLHTIGGEPTLNHVLPPAATAQRPLNRTNEPTPALPTTTSLSQTRHPSLKHPQGVLKKTWAFGHPRTISDVKIEEVLESSTLRTAVLSAFQWDMDWVFRKLRTHQSKLIFVMQAKELELRDQMMRETEHMRKFLRLCFPPMEGQVHCMHSKLMLLFHAEKLRVAIPSANLTSYDWGETGVMENSVFMIDLPRLPNDTKLSGDELPSFGKELLFFLEKSGIDQDVRTGLLNFDFSATEPYAFVHTVGGAARAQELRRTGFPGLSQAVRNLNLQTDERLQIDIAASSIGSLSDDFLRTVHDAARGVDASASSLAAAAQTTEKQQTKQTNDSSIREFIRIYFPTHSTVASSTGGTNNGGTICLQRRWFTSPKFPRDCFRDYRSTRKGLLSHNKILLARGRRGGQNVAWVKLIGERMGKLSWDRSRKEWKLNARNWECGVLIPVPVSGSTPAGGGGGGRGRGKSAWEVTPVGSDDETASESEGVTEQAERNNETGEQVKMDVFKGVLDLPFEYPGQSYEGKAPWYFTER